MTEAHYVPAVVYRDANDTDTGFLFNSWLRSYRSNSEWVRAIPAQIYFHNHKRVVAQLLKDAGVLIAANPDDPDQIFGYAVWQPTIGRVAVLHWVYVKEPYRRLGIGTKLVATVRRLADHNDALPLVGTHHTRGWAALAVKWRLVFNPYVLGDGFDGQIKESQAC
jgi:GNAT superfamily N-acetyltransferase